MLVHHHVTNKTKKQKNKVITYLQMTYILQLSMTTLFPKFK